MTNNMGKNIAYGLAGLGMLIAVYTAREPITNYVQNVRTPHNVVAAADLNPNTIIVRQGDSIERYRLNCAPNTTPTDYKNRVLENNQKDNVAVRQGDLLEVLVDDENANEWCQQRMNENRHLNE